MEQISSSFIQLFRTTLLQLSEHFIRAIQQKAVQNAQFARTNQKLSITRRNVMKMGPNLTEIRRKTVLTLDK
jgi:hypothetical protein